METRRRSQWTSLARWPFAALVGLLPFSLLDSALLENFYKIRGPQPAPAVLQAFLVDEASGFASFERWLSEHPQAKCVNFSTQTSARCLNRPIRSLVSMAEFEVLTAPLAAHLEVPDSLSEPSSSILYYGPLSSFQPTELSEIFASAGAGRGPNIASDRPIVLLPTAVFPQFRIPTPAGSYTPQEIALNVTANLLDHHSLRTTSRWSQFGLSLLSAGFTTWILYTYPIALTAIFVVLLALAQLVLSMVAFDALGLQITIVAPLISSLVAYLLGLSVRLDRRERQEWSLQVRADNLKQLDEMRNNFLSLISHDLKTPLARMQTMLERLAGGDFGALQAAQSDALGRILSANGHLQRTISTLLLLSRIESKDFKIRPQPTDLNEVLTQTVQHHRSSAQERQIEITTEFEPLFLVDVDRGLIAEVVNNVLDNALKYSPSGSRVTVRCGEDENCPELSPPQPGVWIEVQDEGPGIPPEDRARVLQKFVRGSNEQTAADLSVKGTGLGLYLSVFFVEKHLGHLGLFSKVRGEVVPPADPAAQYFADNESGTCLRITLPLEYHGDQGPQIDDAPRIEG